MKRSHGSAPAVGCDRCGGRAVGIDEAGPTLCEWHAGAREGVVEAHRADVGARATGLPEADIREFLDQELQGSLITRVEEDVPLLLGEDWLDEELS